MFIVLGEEYGAVYAGVGETITDAVARLKGISETAKITRYFRAEPINVKPVLQVTGYIIEEQPVD